MSYSQCINCEQMVPTYEKYCNQCLGRYPQLRQVPTFWKDSAVSWEHAKAIAKEEIEAPVAPSRSAAPSEREAFEKWANGRFSLSRIPNRTDGMYDHVDTNRAWNIWQVIRAEASAAPPSSDEKPTDAKSDCMLLSGAAPPSEREAAMINALERVWDSRHEPDKWSLEVSRALELATGKPHPFRTALQEQARAAVPQAAAPQVLDALQLALVSIQEAKRKFAATDDTMWCDAEEVVIAAIEAARAAAVPAPGEIR